MFGVVGLGFGDSLEIEGDGEVRVGFLLYFAWVSVGGEEDFVLDFEFYFIHMDKI